ncbi:MAG: single-stranded-DNA-specific exonuclease RecJ [Clostridiales bacterium]|nr:single-stranded-DNA-specific exonuclease RecJ [Clostridiales bacterium]
MVNKMEKWFIANKKADFDAIGKHFGISPILARIITNRGIIGEKNIHEYLFGTINNLYSPYLMKDMEKGINILVNGINENKKIRVVQDYDVDGCMSGYILVTALKRCGADADYDVPDRKSEGYGINERIIRNAKADGVDILLTCDNGIAAINEVKLAKQLGLTVIVSDHHEVQYEHTENGLNYIIPEADAVIDIKRPDCDYPFKQLCGAGIAYKIAECLYEKFGIAKGELYKLMQFAAVATVCDIVDLTGENRIITREGMKILDKTENFGMRALLDRCLKPGEKISVGRIGFFIGPVINAGGRMSTSILAMRLFFSKSRDEAENILDELITYNNERKKATEDAVGKIVSELGDDAENSNVIIKYIPDCHESVAGIAAGRVKDIYHRPVIVLTDSSDENSIKGSARSVEGFDIFERIMTCRDLLSRFGGHPMAAGLTLEKKNFDEFVRRMNEPGWPEGADKFKRIVIDAAVPFSKINSNLVNETALIEPCGKANTKPVFAAKNVSIRRAMILGKNKNVLKLYLDDGTTELEAIWFGDVDKVVDNIKAKYGDKQVSNMFAGKENNVYTDIIYVPKINKYNGFERIQLDITSFRW